MEEKGKNVFFQPTFGHKIISETVRDN